MKIIPDNSNYVLPNLIIGGLPRNKQDYLLLRKKGFNIFVNLMEPKECKKGKKAPKWDYRDNKDDKDDKDDIEYINFPIKDLETLDDYKMLNFSNFLVDKIKNQEKIYIHCFGGHGRSGILVGIILHLLYPEWSYEDILTKLKLDHQKRKYKPYMIIPQTTMQFNQLYRIITNKDYIFFYDTKR